MNTTHHRVRLGITALALLLSTLNPQLSTVLAQGPLAPPGAPAPTFKTLTQPSTHAFVSAVNFAGVHFESSPTLTSKKSSS